MSIIGWIILGLIAGFIASKIVNKQGEGVILDIVLGIVGAIVGGTIFTWLGAAGVTGLNLWSMLVAIVGAIVILVLYHAMAAHETIAPSALLGCRPVSPRIRTQPQSRRETAAVIVQPRRGPGAQIAQWPQPQYSALT